MKPETLLPAIVEATSTETGLAFFRSLVRSCVDHLDVEGAWITEFLGERQRLRSLAFRLKSHWVEHYEYDIEGTPCGAALARRELVFVPERVLEVFPADNDLHRMKAVSYIGVPVFDESREQVLGHFGAFSVKPMPDTELFRSVFGLFASRAGAELRRLRLEQALRARTDELEAVLRSARDAILVTDDERDIVRANPAARRIFGTDDLEGEFLDRFLSGEGAEKIEPLFERVGTAPETGASIWIPGTFEALTADGEKFAAEGSLSRFGLEGRTYFTLIVRNVNDRLAAEAQIAKLSGQTAYLRQEVERHFGEIVGNSPIMRKVIQAIRDVGPTETTVLVTGETGTGKELVARALHQASRRSAMPLVKVNCAAIPATLIESEFFGHEKGAFTGATAKREGRFTLADGGTLFLDEIGELPLDLQSKLLRVLQEGEFEPVGSSRTRKVDVRVIAATNRDLRKEVSAGRFREDLYYRISVFPLHVPGLRQRGPDIEALAEEFVRRFSVRAGHPPPALTEADRARLHSYAWPGNVRELANVIERALITGKPTSLNLERALPEAESPGAPSPPTQASTLAMDGSPRVFTAEEMVQFEVANIRRALAASGGQIAGKRGAAAQLGLQPSTLTSRIKALGITAGAKK